MLRQSIVGSVWVAAPITGPYRQLHDHDLNERQQVHEHTAAPPRAPEPAVRVSRSGGGH